jgi:chaperonin GroEL
MSERNIAKQELELPARMILHAPAAGQALLRGMDQMTALMRPTLGPIGGIVAIAPLGNSAPPEILDSAATIARRTLQLPDAFENLGAMIVRDLALRVFEEVGDGAATAAILATALVRGAAACLAAGTAPTALRHGLARGFEIASAELRELAQPIDLPSEIASVARSAVGDDKLAALIGEVVDSVGTDGAVLFENGVGAETECEYQDGLSWNEGYLSHFLLKPGETTARLLNPRIFATDIPVEQAEQLVPVLEACIASGDRSLLVIAPEVRDAAVGLLVLNRERGVLESAMAVRAPSFGATQSQILEDIAVLTGGRCLHAEAGDSLTGVSSDDLGRARHAWVTRNAFGILGGQGSREQVQARVTQVKAELKAISGDPPARDKLKERMGKLAGTTAVLRVGARTPAEQPEIRLRLEAGVQAARLAVEHGVVPGGGAALLACARALQVGACRDDDSPGMRILAQALTEPMRTLLRNAGLEAEPVLHEAHCRGVGWSFDVVRREWVNGLTGGLVDPLSVTLTALEAAVSGASAALSSDVLIAKRS